MATRSAGSPIYICHLCSQEFSIRATLLNHLSQCQIKPSTKQYRPTIPQLTQLQLNILLLVKLRPISSKTLLSCPSRSSSIESFDFQVPLSYLYSHNYLTTSNQLSFDDSYCNLDHWQEDFSPLQILEEHSSTNNDHLPSYHIYKYSRRRERDFYSSHSRMKKCNSPPITNNITTNHKSHSNGQMLSIFDSKHYLIHIPTKINHRQRISSDSNQIYPLLLSPNFHTLVKLPNHQHPSLENYSVHIQISFHFLNSIASQEFQIIVQNYERQHELTYTSLSLINLLRQTIYDYSKHFHSTCKRDYFHMEHPDEEVDEHESNHELSIPPLKIRRHDDSSYEIDKRSTSSSSSGMSITQIHNGQSHDDRRRCCLDTRPKKFSSRISDIQINSNSNDTDKKDIPDFNVGSPQFYDYSTNDHQQWKDRTSTKSTYSNEAKSSNQVRESVNDTHRKYQTVALNEGARIRIVNCSNDSNKHSSVQRSSSNTNASKKVNNSIDKLDENWSTKTTRINTRKISSTHSKGSDIFDICPTYQAQSVFLSNEEISHAWLTHNVFYRCHACGHEEFFVVLSRECMRLHVSSKHGNMEENFKQRLSNFLNNQGRALKIFQHYLKWQQPWSEEEIDQIFQLANITNPTNGTS